MHQSTSKKKIYFYLFLFLILSTILNLNIFSKFQNINLINSIDILGLSEKEKKILEENLKIFLNKNIFIVNKNEIEEKLNNSSFLDKYNVMKIFPSKLFIEVKKTEFVGKTFIDLEEYYVGKNGKLTRVSHVKKEYSLPEIFGNFSIKEFLNLQKVLNRNGINLNRLKKYYYYKNNRWDIQYNNNVILRLPSKELEQSIKNYNYLLQKKKINPGNLIDLRIPNKIIFTDENK